MQHFQSHVHHRKRGADLSAYDYVIVMFYHISVRKIKKHRAISS